MSVFDLSLFDTTFSRESYPPPHLVLNFFFLPCRSWGYGSTFGRWTTKIDCFSLSHALFLTHSLSLTQTHADTHCTIHNHSHLTYFKLPHSRFTLTMGQVYVSLSFLLSLCPTTSFELLVAHTSNEGWYQNTFFKVATESQIIEYCFFSHGLRTLLNVQWHTHLSIVLLLILIRAGIFPWCYPSWFIQKSIYSHYALKHNFEWTVDTFKISFSIRSLPHDHDNGLVTTSVAIQCTVVTPHLPGCILPLYSGTSTFKR
jgi:hypothetical protein